MDITGSPISLSEASLPISQSPQTWLIGVDVGGTTTSTLLVDHKHTPHARLTTTTNLTTPEQTLSGIIDTIQQTLNQAGLTFADLSAISLGVPGQVDIQSGVANLAVNLNWYNFPVIELLATQLNKAAFF